MEIKVLGTGCPSCKTLFETTQQAIAELGSDATLTKEEDLLKIIEYNILGLPALVIDGTVVSVDNPEHMHPVQKEKESQIGSKRFDLNSHSGRYAPIFREK